MPIWHTPNTVLEVSAKLEAVSSWQSGMRQHMCLGCAVVFSLLSFGEVLSGLKSDLRACTGKKQHECKKPADQVLSCLHTCCLGAVVDVSSWATVDI
jgi:hypothetical protein